MSTELLAELAPLVSWRHRDGRFGTPLRAALRVDVDRALAVALLVVLAPLIGVLMLLVRLSSPGPALYTQQRVGRRGRVFTIYKLRSMTHNCERLSGPRWAVANDPRVTPLGRLLRRSHLDELPQLWNVARGEMALVGPRPERPVFVHELSRALPRYADRLAVRPGITGLAQVQLPPDADLHGVRHKLLLDLHYIAHRGAWLDLRILLATVGKLLGLPPQVRGRLLGLPALAALLAAETAPHEPESTPESESEAVRPRVEIETGPAAPELIRVLSPAVEP